MHGEIVWRNENMKKIYFSGLMLASGKFFPKLNFFNVIIARIRSITQLIGKA